MGAYGLEYGVRFRLDTRALNSMGEGSRKISEAAATIKELRDSVHSMVSGLAKDMTSVGVASSEAVARLRTEITQLRNEVQELRRTARAGGGVGGDRYIIPPQHNRMGEATYKELRTRYGVSKEYVTSHPMRESSKNYDPSRGTMPIPRIDRGSGQRYYDTMQMMSILLGPLKESLGKIRSNAAPASAVAGPSQLDKAIIDRFDQASIKMTNAATIFTNCVDKIAGIDFVALVKGGRATTPPPDDRAARLPGMTHARANAGQGTIEHVATKQSIALPAPRKLAFDGPMGPQIKEIWESFETTLAEQTALLTRKGSALSAARQRTITKKLAEMPGRKEYASPGELQNLHEEEKRLQDELAGHVADVSKRARERTLRTVAPLLARMGVEQGLINPEPGRIKSPTSARWGGADLLKMPAINTLAQNLMGTSQSSVVKMLARPVNEAIADYILRIKPAEFKNKQLAAATPAPEPTPKKAPRAAKPQKEERWEDLVSARKSNTDLKHLLPTFLAAGEEHVDANLLNDMKVGMREEPIRFMRDVQNAIREEISSSKTRVKPELASLLAIDLGHDDDVSFSRSQRTRGPDGRFARAVNQATLAPTPAPGQQDRTVLPQAASGSMWRRIGGVAERVGLWGGSAAVIYGGVRAFQEGLRTMADFEQSMVNVRKVMNPLGADFKAMGEAAKSMGQEFGVPITAASDAMVTFARQGRSTAEIIDQTRVALLATNVTELDSATTTNALIAAQRQFQLSTSNSIRIIDAWNEVQNTTSVNAEVLIKAMQGAGTVARLSGVDFDSFNGIVAAVGESTRKSGEEIGTSLKFIFQNIRAEKAIEAMQEIGVASMDAAGNYKTFKSVIGELSGKWDDLSEAQKHNIAVSIAGTRRLNDFFVLMDSWKRAQDITTTSMTSSGSAMRENKIAMESLSKQVGQLKAAYDSLWASLGESGALAVLKNVTNTLRNMLDMLGGLNKVTGGTLGGMAGTLGVGAMAAAPFMYMANPGILQTFQRSPEEQELLNAKALLKSRTDARTITRAQTLQKLQDRAAGPSSSSLLMSPTAEGRSLNTFWANGDNRRRMIAGGVMVGTHALKYGYDQSLRSTDPSFANTAMDVGTNIASEASMAAMFWKSTPGAKGVMGKFKGQSTGVKALVAMLAVAAASELYTGVRDYWKNSKAVEQQAQKIGHLRDMEQHYSRTATGLQDAIDNARTGETGSDPARMMELGDTVGTAVPGSVRRDALGNVILGDMTGPKNALDALGKSKRSARAEAIAATVRENLNSKEVADAVAERTKLNKSITPGMSDEKRFEIRGQLARTTQVFDDMLFQPLRALATQAGRDHSGIGGHVQFLEAMGQKGAPTKEVATQFVGDFVEALTHEKVNFGAIMAQAKIDPMQFVKNGFLKTEAGNSSLSMASGQYVKDAEINGPLIDLHKDFKGMVMLSAKRISEVIGSYSIAVEKLVKSNNEILASQKFVADNLLFTKDISGKGGAAGGLLTGSVNAQFAALDRIRSQGLGGFAAPVGTNDKNNIATQFKELIGELNRARHSGKTLSLGDELSASQMIDSVAGQAQRQAMKLVEDYINHQPGKKDHLAGQEELASANISEQELMALTGDSFSEVKAAADKARNAKTAGQKAEEQRYRQQALNMAAGATRDQSDDPARASAEHLRATLASYRDVTAQAVAAQGEEYGYALKTGQVKNIADYRQRSEAMTGFNAVGGLAEDVRSRVGEAQKFLETLTGKPQAEKDRDPGFQKSLTEATNRVKELASTLTTLDNASKNWWKSVEHFDIGMVRLSDEINRKISQANLGEAFGLTGVNALQYTQGQLAPQAAAMFGRGDLTPEGQNVGGQALGNAASAAKNAAQAQIEERDILKKALGTGVLQQRMANAAGFYGGGDTRGGEALIAEYKELLQGVVAANADKLKGMSQTDQQSFFRSINEMGGAYGGKMRDLDLSKDPGFKKNYLLSSDSDRAMIDQVRTEMRQGMTPEDIFSDPNMRAAAKDNPLLNTILEKSLNDDFQKQAAAVAQESKTELTRIRELMATWLTSKGFQVPTPTAGVVGGAAAVNTRGGASAVDARGRIAADDTPAILHKGEVVLTADQADHGLKNLYAGGTLGSHVASGNAMASSLQQKWSDQVYGRSPLATIMSQLPEAQQANLMARIGRTSINSDPLGIGGKNMRMLMSAMPTRIAELGQDTAGRYLWSKYNPTDLASPMGAGSLSMGDVTLDKLKGTGRMGGIHGQANMGAAILGHEYQHVLNRLWRTSTEYTGKNKHYHKQAWAWAMHPDRAASRAQVYHGYSDIREAANQAIKAGDENFYYKPRGQEFVDEIMAAEVQKARSTGRAIDATHRALNRNNFKAWLGSTSLDAFGMLTGQEWGLSKRQARVGGSRILAANGWVANASMPATVEDLLQGHDYRLTTVAQKRQMATALQALRNSPAMAGKFASGFMGRFTQQKGFQNWLTDAHIVGEPFAKMGRGIGNAWMDLFYPVTAESYLAAHPNATIGPRRMTTGRLWEAYAAEGMGRLQGLGGEVGHRVGQGLRAGWGDLPGMARLVGGDTMGLMGGLGRGLGSLGRGMGQFGLGMLGLDHPHAYGHVWAGLAGDVGRWAGRGASRRMGQFGSMVAAEARAMPSGLRNELGSVFHSVHNDLGQAWGTTGGALADRLGLTWAGTRRWGGALGRTTWPLAKWGTSPVWGPAYGAGKLAGFAGSKVWGGGRWGLQNAGRLARGLGGFGKPFIQPGLMGLMALNALKGEQIAEHFGHGDAYRAINPIVQSGLMMGGWANTARMGSFTGFNLGANVLERSALLMEGMGAEGSGLAALGGRAAVGLRYGNMARGLATQGLGKALFYKAIGDVALAGASAGYAGLGKMGVYNTPEMRDINARVGNAAEIWNGAIPLAGQVVGGLGQGAWNLARHGQLRSSLLGGVGTSFGDWGHNIAARSGEYGMGWQGRNWYNPLAVGGGVVNTLDTTVDLLTDTSGSRERRQAEKDERLDARAQALEKLMQSNLRSSSDADWKQQFQGSPTIEGYGKIMGSGAGVLVRSLASSVNVKVGDEALRKLQALAGQMPANTSLVDLLNASGGEGLGGIRELLGAKGAAYDQASGNNRDSYVELTQAVQRATDPNTTEAAVRSITKRLANYRESTGLSDAQYNSQMIQDMRAMLQQDEKAPTTRRHTGGPFTNEAIIHTGVFPQVTIPTPQTTAFFKGLDNLQRLQEVPRSSADTMGMDAQQFTAAQSPASVSNSTTHDGRITLDLSDGFEGALRKLVEMAQAGSRGVKMKVGDKVYDRLV